MLVVVPHTPSYISKGLVGLLWRIGNLWGAKGQSSLINFMMVGKRIGLLVSMLASKLLNQIVCI